MKTYTSFLILFFVAFLSHSQVGEDFPEIQATDLNEKDIVIPKDTKGKYTLIGVAFSEDAQKDLYTWSEPVYNEFLNENSLASMVYDPYVHLILMFTGANQVVYNKAKKEITEGTDESLRKNVVLYKGGMDDYRDILQMKDRKEPYFFVLDKDGKIIYATKGRYSRKALEEVGDLIED